MIRTNQFKTISIREVVSNALQGKPINVEARPLYDLDDVDIDNDECSIVDEFSDQLEVMGYIRQCAEDNYQQKLLDEKSKPEETDVQSKNQKGGIEDEKKAQTSPDASSQTLSQE